MLQFDFDISLYGLGSMGDRTAVEYKFQDYYRFKIAVIKSQDRPNFFVVQAQDHKDQAQDKEKDQSESAYIHLHL